MRYSSMEEHPDMIRKVNGSIPKFSLSPQRDSFFDMLEEDIK
jgi:hypothetical protein